MRRPHQGPASPTAHLRAPPLTSNLPAYTAPRGVSKIPAPSRQSRLTKSDTLEDTLEVRPWHLYFI